MSKNLIVHGDLTQIEKIWLTKPSSTIDPNLLLPLKDLGFVIIHVDGNESNLNPSNLVMIYGGDIPPKSADKMDMSKTKIGHIRTATLPDGRGIRLLHNETLKAIKKLLEDEAKGIPIPEWRFRL